MEGPWELPTGWRWERLGSLGDWYGGGTPSKSNPAFWAGGNLPWVSAKDMKADYIDDTEDHVTDDAVLNSAAKRIPSGSVLCVMRSGILKHSFPVAVTRREVTINQDLRAVHPNPAVEPTFLAYYLRHAAQDVLHECSKDGTTVNSIEAGRLMQYPVPVPKVDVQRRIVARIEELCAEIGEADRALDDANSMGAIYSRALLKAAVTGELTSSWRKANPPERSGGELLEYILASRRGRWASARRGAMRKYVEPTPVRGDLPELPLGWCWATLQQLAFISGGLTVDRKRQPERPVELPYLRVANVQRGHLDLSVIKTIAVGEADVPHLSLQDGDILLNEGGDRDKVGRGWVWRSELPVCLHQNHVFKARPVSDAICPELVSIYLNELGRRFFLDESKQTTNLASISLSKVSAAPVAVPPPAEAREIMRVLQRFSLDDPSAAIVNARSSAAQLRQSVLAAAFRGDLAK